MQATKFESEDTVNSVLSDWLRYQSKDFYAEGIWNLVRKWKKVCEINGILS